MKMANIFNIFVFLVISSVLNAQDFYTYKLFNNEFQVIFPGDPYKQEIPKGLLNPDEIAKQFPDKYKKSLTKTQIRKAALDAINILKSNQPYIYLDQERQLVFSAKSYISGLKYDIGEYKNSTKEMLDESIILQLEKDGRTILNFTSEFNRKQNMYLAYVTSTFFTEGVKRYSTTKHITYKKKNYIWTLIYPSFEDKKIFDSYEKYVHVLK